MVSPDAPSGNGESSDRREFLERTLRVIAAGIGIALLGVLGIVMRVSVRKRELRFFPVLHEEELPRRGVRQVVLNIPRDKRTIEMRAFVVGKDGAFYSLSARCTHLGCFVNWNRNQAEFVCPCHGGRYDMEGKVAGGPPPLPLKRLPLEIRDGMVFVGYEV